MKILLVNPPIYDFAAYDFWLKPYGMLTAAGFLRSKAEFQLFDYLDRQHAFYVDKPAFKSDEWGRGRFYFEKIKTPQQLKDIPRYFRRFGLPRSFFQEFLSRNKKYDYVFIQTTMTYWYPGVAEVIEDIREYLPDAKIILGGNYVTICPEHAAKLGADFIMPGTDFAPLWKYLGIEADLSQPALWEAYGKLNTGTLKLSDGCPFSCTYCSVPKVYGKYEKRPLERALAELDLMIKLGVKNIAFYDDALLHKFDQTLKPFLEEVLKRKIEVNFHTPNALNARFLTQEIADLMVRAGFKTFYLGFESTSAGWQEKTGSKVFSEELAQAVKYLIKAGANPRDITAYQILGHPHTALQQLEQSMYYVNSLAICGLLADFSPIPGTPDGDYCQKWVDMTEPLFHNKTTFPVILLGFDETNRLKDLQRKLNRNIKSP